MKKIIAPAISLALVLSACADGDVTADPDVDSTESSGGSEVCSLTTEQIGDPSLEVLGSYLIDGDSLLCSPDDAAIATFAIFTRLIPAEHREGVIAFVAIDQEASGGTDGAMQDVYDDADEPTGDRLLALDVTGSSIELERTIVHETGHHLFLNAASDVPTTYAEDFNAAFPPGGSYEDAPEDFVTEYAASVEDGGEDMAESWAMFVYGGTRFAGDADDDGELDVVVPGTLAEEKVMFFADYPELVQLREDILASSDL